MRPAHRPGLHAGLARCRSHPPGAGDGGGLATLLVRSRRRRSPRSPDVAEVVTLARGSWRLRGGARGRRARAAIERFAFGGAGYLAHRRRCGRTGASSSAASSVALRRLAPSTRCTCASPTSPRLAAARVCERLRLPFLFTLAPDPHALIRRRQPRACDRDSFVQPTAASTCSSAPGWSSACATRRRPRPATRAPATPGAGRPARPRGPPPARSAPCRGIAIAALDAAPRRRGPAPVPSPAHSQPRSPTCRPPARSAADPLRGPLAPRQGLPAARRGVGGRPRAARDARTSRSSAATSRARRPRSARCSRRSARGRDRHPRRRRSLLLGHRPHAEVLRLMAAARRGVPGRRTGSIYACASDKEEFGMALLEAMGFRAVRRRAPSTGGPPTFIDDGVNGTLADTAPCRRARGLRRAARRPARAAIAPHAPPPRPRALHARGDGAPGSSISTPQERAA